MLNNHLMLQFITVTMLHHVTTNLFLHHSLRKHHLSINGNLVENMLLLHFPEALPGFRVMCLEGAQPYIDHRSTSVFCMQSSNQHRSVLITVNIMLILRWWSWHSWGWVLLSRGRSSTKIQGWVWRLSRLSPRLISQVSLRKQKGEVPHICTHLYYLGLSVSNMVRTFGCT